ncbi:(-)-isopiperitenol/(-)-carveol dehydrogenase, mitochondrial [Olea europaea subsp. europaea]|uniref:(-)-isopiperitenol/(-)-carveol dehydrogenase, mitochondrial n=1 Tax=Olea europaea subsp. europaea TaxID=158383 RepID=A0A8S0UMZ8_OLEEU|nr:(-)-isopiperitenol/(-)-carveol dehydrogenase, mitochondrial [Olea europaea subsp. europaea]
MILGEGIGKGLINRAFGEMEKGKWIEGASQIELEVGSIKWLGLEEKLTNLESENKVLRQQALAMAQNNKLLSSISRSKTNVDLPST